jgi:hypothetical protein
LLTRKINFPAERLGFAGMKLQLVLDLIRQSPPRNLPEKATCADALNRAAAVACFLLNPSRARLMLNKCKISLLFGEGIGCGHETFSKQATVGHDNSRTPGKTRRV